MSPPLPHRRLLIGAALCLASAVAWLRAPRMVAVEPADRALLPGAESLAVLSGAFSFDETAEQFDKRRGWDGATTLRYRYLPGDMREPQIRAFCRTETTVEGAEAAFQEARRGAASDWTSGGGDPVSLVELARTDDPGDDSWACRIEREGRVVGYGLAVRVGRRVASARIERLMLTPRTVEQFAVELARRLAGPALEDA